MFLWKTRFHPVVSAVLLAFSLSAPAVAAGSDNAKANATLEIKASDYQEMGKAARRQLETERRRDIVKRTNEIFVLLGGEKK